MPYFGRVQTGSDEPDPDLSVTQLQVRSAKTGDGEALGKLLERYLPRVRGMVAAHMGRRLQQIVDVDDLVQETMRDAMLGIEKIDQRSEGMFAHWLARVVENNVRDHARETGALKRGQGEVRRFADLATSSLSDSLFAGREFAASQVARGTELEERIESAMLRLGSRYREVIALRVRGELSYRDIADVMQLPSENTANVLFLRARKQLLELVEPEEP